MNVSMKQNNQNFYRYKDVLNVFYKIAITSDLERDIGQIQNSDFRVHDQGKATYEKSKLRVFANFDKHYVMINGIHTRRLEF